MAKKAYIGVDGVARKVKKGYVGVPFTCTPLEYIESTGTQYVDTGFKPNQSTGVTIDFKLAAVSSWQCVFGAANFRENDESYAVWHSGDDFEFYYDGENAPWTDLDGTARHMIRASKNVAVADGTNRVSLAESTFTTNYPICLFAVNYANEILYHASMKLYSCQIYDNGMLVRDFIPAKTIKGEVGLYDRVFHEFYRNAGTGEFIAGPELGTVGQSASGILETVVARKIKKAYIGIGGVARPFMATGLVYNGVYSSAMSLARSSFSAEAIGDIAIVAGGYTNGALNLVEAFDKNLVRTIPTSLSKARWDFPATTIGQYVIFPGGYSSGSVADVDGYTKSLTKIIFNLIKGRNSHAAFRNENYAIIAGGSGIADNTHVEAYNSNFTSITPSKLAKGRHGITTSGTTVGAYGILAGGYVPTNPSPYMDSIVDAYNGSLVRSNPSQLSFSTYTVAGTVGDRAIFISTSLQGANAYDSNLTRSVLTASTVFGLSCVATLEGYCLAVGNKTTEVYSPDLTKTTIQAFAESYRPSDSAVISNKALFFGGSDIINADISVYEYN